MYIDNEVIDLLTEYVTNERLFRIVEDDAEIRAARIRAEEKCTLSDEQRDLFDSFIAADSEAAARMEFLTYQQGLKDMFNLIMSLQNKPEEEA